MKIRFHLDESVNHSVASGLRKRGIDVTTATDAGLVGASDGEQLAFAFANDRVAMSHDRDFLRLDADGTPHAGIAYCHQRHRSIGQIIGALTLLWRTKTAEEMRGLIVFV